MTMEKHYGEHGKTARAATENFTLKDLARAHTQAAVEALVESLSDPKLKVPAARALLDLGWGKIAGDDEHQGEPIERIERIIVRPENKDG